MIHDFNLNSDQPRSRFHEIYRNVSEVRVTWDNANETLYITFIIIQRFICMNKVYQTGINISVQNSLTVFVLGLIKKSNDRDVGINNVLV